MISNKSLWLDIQCFVDSMCNSNIVFSSPRPAAAAAHKILKIAIVFAIQHCMDGR